MELEQKAEEKKLDKIITTDANRWRFDLDLYLYKRKKQKVKLIYNLFKWKTKNFKVKLHKKVKKKITKSGCKNEKFASDMIHYVYECCVCMWLKWKIYIQKKK